MVKPDSQTQSTIESTLVKQSGNALKSALDIAPKPDIPSRSSNVTGTIKAAQKGADAVDKILKGEEGGGDQLASAAIEMANSTGVTEQVGRKAAGGLLEKAGNLFKNFKHGAQTTPVAAPVAWAAEGVIKAGYHGIKGLFTGDKHDDFGKAMAELRNNGAAALTSALNPGMAHVTYEGARQQSLDAYGFTSGKGLIADTGDITGLTKMYQEDMKRDEHKQAVKGDLRDRFNDPNDPLLGAYDLQQLETTYNYLSGKQAILAERGETLKPKDKDKLDAVSEKIYGALVAKQEAHKELMHPDSGLNASQQNDLLSSIRCRPGAALSYSEKEILAALEPHYGQAQAAATTQDLSTVVAQAAAKDITALGQAEQKDPGAVSANPTVIAAQLREAALSPERI